MLKEDNSTLKTFDLDQFLESGFVIQSPTDDKLIVGQFEGEDRGSKSFIYYYDFYLNNYVKFHIFNSLTIEKAEFVDWLKGQLPLKLEIKKVQSSEKVYEKDVESILNWIDQDEKLTKLVSVCVSEYEAKNNAHPISNLINMDAKLNGFIYGAWKNKEGFLGLTPEPLFYKQNSSYYTLALAGTIATDDKHFASLLLASEKDNHEQELVIEDIKEKLAPYAKNVRIHQKEVLNFGKIAHLKNLIEFSYSGEQKQLVEALSPTAALGGYPSKESLKYLRRTQYYRHHKENRKFGGVFGIESENYHFALVSIRNIFWKNKKLEIHSGGGIVAGSNVQSEVIEIQNKRKIIEELF